MTANATIRYLAELAAPGQLAVGDCLLTPQPNVLSHAPITAGGQVDSGAMPCGSRRWHCAWTHPSQEVRAEWSLMELGFHVLLPLVLERGWLGGERHIVPAFPRYLLVAWDPARDQWRRIYRARGIAGLVGPTLEQPTPIPHGVVEALQARMSDRRIVDDPGVVPPVQTPSQGAHWHDFTRLSGKARSELLLRLFGREEQAA